MVCDSKELVQGTAWDTGDLPQVRVGLYSCEHAVFTKKLPSITLLLVATHGTSGCDLKCYREVCSMQFSNETRI